MSERVPMGYGLGILRIGRGKENGKEERVFVGLFGVGIKPKIKRKIKSYTTPILLFKNTCTGSGFGGVVRGWHFPPLRE